MAARRPPSLLTAPALRLIVRTYLRRLGQEHRADRVRVVFNRRLRTAIGRCDPAAATIYLNPRLLDRYPDELVPTLVHELCHVVAGIEAGHGPRWKEAMLRCGLRPDTYHDLDVAAFSGPRYRWRCRSCGTSYLRRTRAAHRYRCGDSGSGLTVVEEGRAAREARPPRRRRR